MTQIKQRGRHVIAHYAGMVIILSSFTAAMYAKAALIILSLTAEMTTHKVLNPITAHNTHRTFSSLIPKVTLFPFLLG